MPHGGPYVSETIDEYDEWSQMLAHYGYMVLQPQYRGSRKYGLDYYRSAFIDGSEAGRAMQDDKDDGALYLVKQGRVDPDRIAMFGWSYGGYAALVAASRENQIYQCAIAGAAVTDPDWQLDQYRYRMDGIQKTEQLTTWDGAVSPIKEVDKVNIPLFIIHGDNDQRVPPDHYYMYVDELEKAGIAHKKLLLEKADHFSSTLFYHHKMELYDNMLQFFEGECGLKRSGPESRRYKTSDQLTEFSPLPTTVSRYDVLPLGKNIRIFRALRRPHFDAFTNAVTSCAKSTMGRSIIRPSSAPSLKKTNVGVNRTPIAFALPSGSFRISSEISLMFSFTPDAARSFNIQGTGARYHGTRYQTESLPSYQQVTHRFLLSPHTRHSCA